MSQNDIYASNLACLKKNHPEIYKKLKDSDIDPLGEIIALDRGEKNLKLTTSNGNTMYLHGETGPDEDTKQFLSIVPEHASGVIIMIGLGLGKPCLEILKQRKGIRHLFIFESSLGIFKQALQAYDLSELFSDAKVTFCLDKAPQLGQVFFKAFKALELEDIQILKHTPTLKVYPELDKLQNNIYEYLNSFSIRGATTKSFGKKFTRNRIKNLKRYRNDILIDSMENALSGVPAVLIAGGPSLDKNISLLKEFKGKAVLLAVDTVVPKLLSKGIIPEFVSSIDPQHATLKKFKGSDLHNKDISLICSAWVSPKVPFNLPVERVFWTFGGRTMEQWINSMAGGHKTYVGAGTVAHLNLHVAIDMGCSPIIFVGQDLAYSDQKDHASDVVLKNTTEMNKILKSKDGWHWVKGFYGEQIKTSRSFLDNKRVFEETIAPVKDREFINATEGGVHIEGARPTALADVLINLPQSNKVPAEIISQVATPMGQSAIEGIKKEFEDFLQRGKDILKLIRTVTSLTSETRKGVNRLCKKPKKNSSFSDLPNQLQKKISRIDDLSARLDNQGVFWHLLDEVTFEGLRESERMKFKIEDKSETSYFDWILKSIKRLDYINQIRKENIEWISEDISAVLEFHRKESRIFENSTAATFKEQRLSEFYSEQGINALAMKYLDITKGSENSGLGHFIKGCCHAYCGKPEAAETHFSKAMAADPGLADKIHDFKWDQAQDHLGFGKKWIGYDSDTPIYLFLEGLTYAPEHPELIDALKDLLKNELDDIDAFVSSGQKDIAQTRISTWMNTLRSLPALEKKMGGELMARLFATAGQTAILQSKPQAAYGLLLKSIQYAPDIPQYYVQLTDLSFSLEDYTNGVRFLNKAVELDRSNAKIWELIGDRMAGAGNLEDALAAYENCFTIMPQHLHLLRKIAQIYMRMGKAQAAEEAENQYKKLAVSRGK